MESSNNGCPTEILIDLKEEDFVPSYLNYKNIHTNSYGPKPVKCVQNDRDNYELKQEKYQCIMDMSPFKLKNACKEPGVKSFAESKQTSGRAEDDCPTGLLIDLPHSSRTCPKQQSLLDSHQEETLLQYKSLNLDVKVKEYKCMEENKYSVLGDSDNPCSLFPVMKEVSLPRLRWKTPSPQSMSRINKEASKIIHNLNSSLVEEDTLLCEEVLPIPINFDLDENSDEEASKTNTENGSLDCLSNQKSSISIQTEPDVNSNEISETVLDSSSSINKDALISSKCNSLAPSPLEKFDSKSRGKDVNKCTTSEELPSSEVQSSSLDDSEVFSSNDETNDVFTENNMPSEDKENIQERKDKKVLPSKVIIRSKAVQKNSVSLKNIERPTLKNLSNVNNVNSRHLSSTNKINSALNYNFLPKSKELQSQGKQQLKKAISVEPRLLKGISRSNSFQNDNKRESIFSFPQRNSNKPKPSLLSEYKSSSSDVKPLFTPLKTPNKRYSIATPLQSTSIKKSTLTPALSRIQNPSVPRFTPQSASGRRLSFSKSWQPSDRSSSKVLKNQNTGIRTSSAVERPSFCGAYSSKSNKQALNKSISLLSSQISKDSLSTTSKRRFSSKLNLPSTLPAEQDRKLARVLFPSISSK